MFRIRTAIDQRCDNSSYIGIVASYEEILPNISIGGNITGPTGPNGGGSGTDGGFTGPTGSAGLSITGPTGSSGGGEGFTGPTGPVGLSITGPTGSSGGGTSIETISSLTGTSLSTSGTTIFSSTSTNSSYITTFLPDASEGTIKVIEMETQSSSPVNIITNKGRISLERSLTQRELLFYNGEWKIQNPIYSSFYPSSNIAISSFTGSAEVDGIGLFDEFGYSVCIDSAGTTAVVGAPNNISGALPGEYIGCLTILSTDTGVWSVDTTIIPSDYTGTNVAYGTSVSISKDGTVIAVGAPNESSV